MGSIGMYNNIIGCYYRNRNIIGIGHCIWIGQCEWTVMALSDWQWPRPIKNGLYRIMWRCTHCTETDNNTDSHRSRSRSRSRPLSVWLSHNTLQSHCICLQLNENPLSVFCNWNNNIGPFSWNEDFIRRKNQLETIIRNTFNLFKLKFKKTTKALEIMNCSFHFTTLWEKSHLVLVAPARAEWPFFSLWCLFACLFASFWTYWYFVQEINIRVFSHRLNDTLQEGLEETFCSK